MRSRQKSLKVPWPLDAEMKAACKEMGFENDHACWIGAAIYFCLTVRRLHYVREVANENPKKQSYLIEQLFSFPYKDIDASISFFERSSKS